MIIAVVTVRNNRSNSISSNTGSNSGYNQSSDSNNGNDCGPRTTVAQYIVDALFC